MEFGGEFLAAWHLAKDPDSAVQGVKIYGLGFGERGTGYWSSFSLAHRMRKNRWWGFRVVLPRAIGVVPVSAERVLGQHLAGHDAAPGHEHPLDLGD